MRRRRWRGLEVSSVRERDALLIKGFVDEGLRCRKVGDGKKRGASCPQSYLNSTQCTERGSKAVKRRDKTKKGNED